MANLLRFASLTIDDVRDELDCDSEKRIKKKISKNKIKDSQRNRRRKKRCKG